MKYGLLTYEEDEQVFNVGDNIQSLAAKQFLPKVDEYINREKLGDYKGEPIKMILNGWFTHNLNDWTPAENIIPLFVSFHLNETLAKYLLTEKAISTLKKHAPIGCRDYKTVELLSEKNIEAYYTGCLTLTLDHYKVEESERNDTIYIVDPLYGYPLKRHVFKNYKYFIKSILNGNIFRLNKRKKHLKKIIDKDLLNSAVYTNQQPPAGVFNDNEKFEMADDLLKQYAKAKLVITSRIHCALPCLAMGTPVIFLNGFSNPLDTCRFEGIIELFNRVDINTKTGEWTTNFELKTNKIDKNTVVKNLNKHKELAENLKKTCVEFIES